MQSLSSSGSNKKSLRPRGRAPPTSSLLPDGWLPVEPHSCVNRDPKASRGLNANPTTACGPDALGLARAVDPLTFLVRKPPLTTANRGHSDPGVRQRDEPQQTAVRQSPRHQRLQTTLEHYPAAEVFSPQRSLRLASLPVRPLLPPKDPHGHEHRLQSNQQPAALPPSTPQTMELPLHELIQRMDDAVEADPHAELNQTAITRLFMDQWLRQFDADRRNFKSIAVRYEVGFQELQQRTVNLPRPNDLITTFCCKVLEDLTPHFGPYAPLFRVLSAEIRQSIYSRDGLSYFALVKHQKRLLLTLRKDKEGREERNDLLADDIANVYAMFRRFLSECTNALTRSLLCQWYSVAIVSKKNSKKYIEHFSAWFGSSPKALVPKLFAAWKHDVAKKRTLKIQKQLQIDLQGLSAVKRQVDELTRQRDVAQVENLAVRNDRKQAESWAQQLEQRIKAASVFLDTTPRREALVCQEGQLRVEAVACLPPLILESLLRGYHGVGFLQQSSTAEQFVSTASGATCDSSETKEPTQARPSLIQECFEEIVKRRGRTRVGSCLNPAQAGRSNSICLSINVDVVKTSDQASPPQAASSMTLVGAGRRAAGAVSQDELSGRTFSKLFHSARERIEARGEMALFTPAQAQETPSAVRHQPRQHENGKLARDYKQLLHAIRVQDEHYASHSKLFSSRMLESHEVSLVPIPNRSVQDLDGRVGADSGDLGVINGAKRFWTPRIVASGKPKTPLKSGKSRRFTSRTLMSIGQQNQTQPASLGALALLQEGDFEISPRHSRGFTELFLAHLATEYGALLFSPADLSAFTHNVYLHPGGENEKTSEEDQVAVLQDANKVHATAPRKRSSRIQPPPQVTTTDTPPSDTTRRLSETNADHATGSGDPLRNIQPLVTAYSAWNQISDQLIAAGVVQSRGIVPKATVEAAVYSSGGDQTTVQSTSAVPVPGTPIRPILQHQFEPLGHNSFAISPRDKGVHGRRMSFTGGDASYHTARIRHLSPEAPARLIESMETLHASVKATTSKLRDFHITCRQVRDLQLVQWEQASELASQFVSARETAPRAASSSFGDQRQHVFECISLSNSSMRRLLSVEDNPESELMNVRAVFETHQRLLRRLYTPHRGSIKHAVSLDDLWHIVKILRLPREIHVLPILRDEELVANGYEQLFSPEDLAELLLQLCNEQFHPQVTPLSARVEYFIFHHLPLAVQNQSLIRAVMHHSDVKHAISSHSQTIRIIFRRYCAKERELMMPASGAIKQRQRHTGHGITKYMRMVDWLAFIQDYHLLRARFSMEQATSLFRTVQEVTAGRDESLELIYSEFCEALMGVAMWYFPDPFLKPTTKVTQFLRRYLPLSPDEAHDYA